ncbi:hypothetical protein AN189_13000 [Loktanella sp. 3ANDIMAR09]|uniref:hypothetical protein n=1 Tax=Loktanella sp. 3ANDIMAR09 TaxID=1225657 RepID=UPI0006FE7ED4|nr:hypothetical protein [Loktanella sp. 3ANDIMAR09]KQI67986.1 hypothetical protein AN189_13000 [Loktanella sp. 3ANDIMAR09]
MRDIEINESSELKIGDELVGTVVWCVPFGAPLHAPSSGLAVDECEQCEGYQADLNEVEDELSALVDRHKDTLAELAALKAKLAEVQKP